MVRLEMSESHVYHNDSSCWWMALDYRFPPTDGEVFEVEEAVAESPSA
jgi:hypothetical protein